MRSLAFILLPALLVLAWGCGKSPEFVSAYGEEVLAGGALEVASADELARRLIDQSEHLDEIWAKFGVTVRRDGGRVLPSFTATALYQEPGRIKLGLSRFEVGTVYSILILGDEAQLYANREGRLFYGTMEELAEKTPLLSGLSPRDLVTAITVQQDLAQVLAGGGRRAVIDKGTHLLVGRRHPVSGRQYIWLVRKSDALVQEVLIRDRTGREEVRVVYRKYKLVENQETGRILPYPEELLFHLIPEDLTVEAKVKEYRLTPEFPEAIWSLPEPDEAYPLRSISFEDI